MINISIPKAKLNKPRIPHLPSEPHKNISGISGRPNFRLLASRGKEITKRSDMHAKFLLKLPEETFKSVKITAGPLCGRAPILGPLQAG